MQILSVNVSQPCSIVASGVPMTTTIHKRPVQGDVAIGELGVAGDGRVSQRKFGDAYHAVSALSAEHYAFWRAAQARDDFRYGEFGENLTLAGGLETEIQIGDVFRAGTALLEVAQPRIPCMKWRHVLGLTSSRPILDSRRLGFYLRVLEPGIVRSGDDLVRVDADPAGVTVDEFIRISQFDYWDAEGLGRLLGCRHLAPAWRVFLEDKQHRAREADGWLGYRTLIVSRREALSADVVSLWLRDPDDRRLPPFAGGQFVTLAVRPEGADAVMRRPYFLCGDSRDRGEYRIAVRRPPRVDLERRVGLVSHHLHDPRVVGSSLRVAAPRGVFTLASRPTDTDSVIVVCAGIGVASALALTRDAVRDIPHLPLVVVSVVFDGGADPFGAELRAVVNEHPRGELHSILGAPHGADVWSAVYGASASDRQRPAVFLCGSLEFVTEHRARLNQLGVPAGDVASESFDDGRQDSGTLSCQPHASDH